MICSYSSVVITFALAFSRFSCVDFARSLSLSSIYLVAYYIFHVVCSVNLILFTFIMVLRIRLSLSLMTTAHNRFYLVLWRLSRSSELWDVRCQQPHIIRHYAIHQQWVATVSNTKNITIHYFGDVVLQVVELFARSRRPLPLFKLLWAMNDKINVRTCDITMFEYCCRL